MTYPTTEWLLAETNKISADYLAEIKALDASLRDKKIPEDEYDLRRALITGRYLRRIKVACG